MNSASSRNGGACFNRVMAAFACLVWLLGSAAPAQDVSRDPDPLPPQAPNQKTMVFTLKYANAESVAQVLQRLYSKRGVIAVAHQATNSVLVQAPPSDLAALQGVLNDLDAKATDTAARAPVEEEPQTRIFRLKDVRLDKDLQSVLKQVLPGNVALDSERNLVVVQGTPKALLLSERILAEIDQRAAREAAPGKPPPEVWQVRVVWLIRGASGLKDLPPPPPDLKAVGDELAKVGLDRLAMVSQTFVVALTNQKFSVTYYPQLYSPEENEPCVVQLTGTISGRQEGPPALQLTLSASQTLQKSPQPGPPGFPRAPPIQQNLCQLQTTVITPPGHPAVLCVTPVGEMTSVFVIQLSPKL